MSKFKDNNSYEVIWRLFSLLPLRSITKRIRPHMHVCMLSHYSCVWLFAIQWTIAHQAPLWDSPGMLDWVAMPSSRGSSSPRDWTHVSCIAVASFITQPQGKPRPCIESYRCRQLYRDNKVKNAKAFNL